MKQIRAWQNLEDLDALSSTVQWKLNDWLVYWGIFLQGMVMKVFSSDLGNFLYDQIQHSQTLIALFKSLFWRFYQNRAYSDKCVSENGYSFKHPKH